MRDLHTNYLLPRPFSGKVAFLPFLVEEYHAADGSHYVVSRVVQGFSAPGFGPGAELTSWSGMSVDRAVELNADRFAGSNDAARHARGVESLTVRSLRSHLPPVEQWVVVGYRGTDGADRELRQDWLVADNLPPFADVDALSPAAANSGVDIGGDEIGRAKTLLFAPAVAGYGLAGFGSAQQEQFAGAGADLPTSMPQVFRARTVATASGTFGHLRIFTFSVDDPDAFVAEFIRLVDQLPDNGLILDVRGNGGGHIFASEFTLQTLTPHPMVPEPVQFAATALNRRICRQHNGQPDRADRSHAVGGVAGPGDRNRCGLFGVVPDQPGRTGPTRSASDTTARSCSSRMRAATPRRTSSPPVSRTTASGPSWGWTRTPAPGAPTCGPTPCSSSCSRSRPSIRSPRSRTCRAGRTCGWRSGGRCGSAGSAGTPVEDLGVVPDELHPMTRDDVLSGNKDLLDHAGALLAALPVAAVGRPIRQRSPAATVTLTLQVAGSTGSTCTSTAGRI